MANGFQTQLTETANKQIRPGAPLLEAFLDANGRLAFRFVNADGSIVPQPRITTPGFAQPPITSGTTPLPSTIGGTSGAITPSASEVLTDFGGGDSPGIGGGGGPDSGEDFGGLSLQSSPLTRSGRIGLGALGIVPGLGLATGATALANKLGIRGVIGGALAPQVGTTGFADIVQAGREASSGFSGTGLAEATAGLSELAETEDFGAVVETTGLAGPGGGGVTTGPTEDPGRAPSSGPEGGAGRDTGGVGEGGDPKVICTQLHTMGLLSKTDWLDSMVYAKRYLTDTHFTGYYTYALPVVRTMRKGHWIKTWKYITQHRANHIAFVLGKREQPDRIGQILKFVLENISYILGMLPIRKRDWRDLYTTVKGL